MFKELPATSYSINRRKRIYGVGINDAPYNVYYLSSGGQKYICPYYRTWRAMLERCYSPTFLKRNPSYDGTTVSPQWLYFSAFRDWMVQQDWQNKVLDKDLLGAGNKHYSPNTCLFISKELNNLLTLRAGHRGLYPLGVSKTTIKGNTYFTATCRMYGKKVNLGYFKDPSKASDAYRKGKLAYIKELASKESDLKVKHALLNLS